jgi:RNA polymerase sigma-70 factor, ECF subfamily
MASRRTREEFEQLMLPHLASAHHLALWLLRNAHDAEDAVQDSYLKAFRAFDTWRGDSANAWLLKIVRNTCMTKFRKRQLPDNIVHLDTVSTEPGPFDGALTDNAPLPDQAVIASDEQRRLRHAVQSLSPEFREAIVLREFEDLTYQQISDITEAPIGTVMSRLSRARRQLLALMRDGDRKGQKHGL